MRCDTCDQAERTPVRRTKMVERDGRVAVVTGVPMEECPACGERWLTLEQRLIRETGSMDTVAAGGSDGPMLADLAAKHGELVDLCRKFGVRRLDVFGSAVTEEFDPARSDVDFLVEMDPPEGQSYLRAFFGLQEALEQLLGHPVDLVSPSSLENPYFAASVERTRRELFAA